VRSTGTARARAKGIRVGVAWRLSVELRHEVARRTANGEIAYGIANAIGIDSVYGGQIFG